jgi:hypothetical protein
VSFIVIDEETSPTVTVSISLPSVMPSADIGTKILAEPSYTMELIFNDSRICRTWLYRLKGDSPKFLILY